MNRIKSFFVKNRIYICLFLIILIAFSLRFYKIDKFPVSLYWDEAAIAYNAKSIVETGRDEYGNLMPLLFRSFEDYKLPGSVYVTAISVMIFGLNEFSARFPSAFFGTLTVLFTYCLCCELFTNNLSNSFVKDKSKQIALIASFLLAISPWHIQFSRAGFEANIGLFFIVLAAWMFFRGFRNKLWYIFSFFTFGISFYFYRSILVFVPLLLFGMFFIFRKELIKAKRAILLSLIILFFIFIPLAISMFSDKGMIRANQVNIVNSLQKEVLENAKKEQQANAGIIGKIIYNRRLVYVKEISKSYLQHFDPRFLFIAGDPNGRHSVVDMGLLYYWEAPFLLLGFLLLFRINKKIRNFVLLWILIAPIPAAFSIPTPHALRTLNILPMPQILISLGLLYIFLILNKNKRLLFSLIMVCVVIFFLINYLNLYYGKNAELRSRDWADGYKELTQYVFANEGKYDKVIISGHYWEPYIYFLFYKNYDPSVYQRFGTSERFDRYLFGGTSWDKDKNSVELGDLDLKKFGNSEKLLVALSPEEYTLQKSNIRKLSEIKNHNNELVFIIGEVR